jgi:hypothetical protein
MSTQISPKKTLKIKFFFSYKSQTKAYVGNRITWPLKVTYKEQIDNKQYEIPNFVYDGGLIVDQFRDNMYL